MEDFLTPTSPQRRRLPERAADTTAEDPWPVRLLTMRIAEYVDRMSQLWVEGQIVELNRRSGNLCFLTLRDPDADMSLTVTVSTHALDAMPAPARSGQRVVVQAKPVFWTRRGTLILEGRQIRPVGEGDLLSRIETLKHALAAEGLFDSVRKRRPPFLPHTVGLICGRESAARRDVVENARLRWPAVRFEIREVPVQGPDAVSAVCGALAELDLVPEVEVIVIARGGGSFEDLLPFSSETMLRAVARARTPVVSAIGHEVDTPLLDLVADIRASTPTDAARYVVPDVTAERDGLDATRTRLTRTLLARAAAERRHLEAIRSRPALNTPSTMLLPHRQQLSELRRRSTKAVDARYRHAHDEVRHLRAQMRALSPLSTMQRGYAVVEHGGGGLVTARDQVAPGDRLRIRVAGGVIEVEVVDETAGAPR